ncbi:hypothetical protein PG985_008471 [Apiospora marii]|uniref:uncharacterized protein n=1 Tax=Apiospora marii TaxID=335849 RepID=UPI0031301135
MSKAASVLGLRGNSDEVVEAPVDQLCSKCEQLHISKAKFLPHLGNGAPGLHGTLAPDVELLGMDHSSLGFLDDIYDRCTSCSFCWLILSATYREGGSIGSNGLTETGERVQCCFDWRDEEASDL